MCFMMLYWNGVMQSTRDRSLILCLVLDPLPWMEPSGGSLARAGWSGVDARWAAGCPAFAGGSNAVYATGQAGAA